MIDLNTVGSSARENGQVSMQANSCSNNYFFTAEDYETLQKMSNTRCYKMAQLQVHELMLDFSVKIPLRMIFKMLLWPFEN